MPVDYGRHYWVLDQHRQCQVIATGHRDPMNGLYCFGKSFQANTVEFKDEETLWHHRLGHLSFSGLNSQGR
jgi:hypothetical protein